MMNIAGKYSQETIGQVGKLEENSGPRLIRVSGTRCGGKWPTFFFFERIYFKLFVTKERTIFYL